MVQLPQLKDSEYHLILSALNACFHDAIDKLNNQSRIGDMERNMLETQRDLSLNLLEKIQ